MRAGMVEAEPAVRNPMRGTCLNCCASLVYPEARIKVDTTKTRNLLFIRSSLNPNSKTRLLNHFIRPSQHIRRDREVDLLGSFQIDHQFKLGWLLHRQISGLGTLKNLVNILSGAAGQIGRVDSVPHESSRFHNSSTHPHRREPVLCRKLDKRCLMNGQYRASQLDDCVCTPLACLLECGLNILGTSYV